MVPPEVPWTGDYRYLLVSFSQKWALVIHCFTEQSKVKFKKEAAVVCLEHPALRSLSFATRCILS